MSIAVTTTDPTNTGVSTTSSSSLTGSNAADLQSSFLTLLVAQLNHGTEGEYGGDANHPPARFNDGADQATNIDFITARYRSGMLFYFFCHSYTCSAFNACAHWRADRSSNVYTAANVSRLLRYGSGISHSLSQ